MSDTMTISPYGECRLWPFRPNWNANVVETFSHLTEILDASRVGKEQRISGRQTPRKRIDFRSTTTGSDFRLMQALLNKRQSAPFVVPEVSRKVGITSGLAGNGVDAAITVDAAAWWLAVGAPVVLVVGRTYFLRVIATVDGPGTGITFTTAETDVVPAGAKVHPGLIVYFQPVSPAHQTNVTAEFPLSANVIPASEPARTIPAATVTFNDREVFLRKINWADLPTNTFEWPAIDVDFSVGTMRRFLPQTFGSRTMQGTFVSKSYAQVKEIEDFYLRMRGMQDEFYLPTWENNLPPKTALTSAGTQLRTAGTVVYDSYFGSTVYKAVVVMLRDGTKLYRLVSTMTTNAGDTLITFTSAWPSTIQVADILMVSWMPVCRLASDDLVVTWLTDQVATVQLSALTLEDLAMAAGDLP